MPSIPQVEPEDRPDLMLTQLRETAKAFRAEGDHGTAYLMENAAKRIEGFSEGPRAPVTANGRDDLYTQATVDDYERELAGLKSYAKGLKDALAELCRLKHEKRLAEALQPGSYRDKLLAAYAAGKDPAWAAAFAALIREPSVVIDNKGAGSALPPAVPSQAESIAEQREVLENAVNTAHGDKP